MLLNANLEHGMEIDRNVEVQILYYQVENMFNGNSLLTMIKETKALQTEVFEQQQKG